MLEEAPRSYADLCADAVASLERAADARHQTYRSATAYRADLALNEHTHLARIVAELAQRLAGDVDGADR